MDNASGVKVNAELKADLQPVIDSTPGAINKLFELLFGVHHAKKKHLIEMINTQKKIDKASIENGLAIFNIEDNELEYIEPDQNKNPLAIIKNEIERNENINIINCAKHAAKELIDIEAPTNKEISKNFFNRWRNEAKLIDDEYAQSIWGLILAEEVQRPDSISLRTLDILKNLSKSEAELFNQMGQYIVHGSSLITGEHINDFQIKTLAEAGLIIFAGVYRTGEWSKTRLNYKDKDTKTGHYLDFNNTLIFTDEYPIEQTLSVSFIPLTEPGKAIYNIALKNNNWELKRFIKSLFKNVKKINSITCYKYTNYSVDNNINMDDPIFFSRSDF